jgi:hypothetical protein
MAITGVRDIEFRIVCACRDGNVHTIKESGPSGVVIELESMPCGLVRQDKHIVVGCMSNVVRDTRHPTRHTHPVAASPSTPPHAPPPRLQPPHLQPPHLQPFYKHWQQHHARVPLADRRAPPDPQIHAFTLRGKKAYSIYLPEAILCMELLALTRTRTAKAMLVGLTSGEVRLYAEKHLVATLHLNEPMTGLRFGCYGREEGALALVGASGALTIKMLQRTAKFDAGSGALGPPPEQDVPLSIPKKTKLYVEQTQREREQATDMHRAFQRDLCKLRLSTARAYVKMITDGQGPMSYSSGSALRLTAQVQGLGPRFKIKLSLQNTGSKAVSDLSVALNYNAMIYRIKAALFGVPVRRARARTESRDHAAPRCGAAHLLLLLLISPCATRRLAAHLPCATRRLTQLLVPGLIHRIDAELECVDENGSADVVRVFVCPPKSAVPILSAIVTMPQSELLLTANVS